MLGFWKILDNNFLSLAVALVIEMPCGANFEADLITMLCMIVIVISHDRTTET